MSKSGPLSDTLIADLRSGDDRLINKAILYLYDQSKTQVRAYILRNSGRHADFEDVLQEGIAVFYSNAVSEEFLLKGSPKSYLFGICKNLWLKKLNRKSRLPLDTLEDYNVSDEVEDRHEDGQIALISEMMKELSMECQKLLTMFYFDKKSMMEIASLLAYKEGSVAKSKKYKCLQSLKSKVLSHPKLQELL